MKRISIFSIIGTLILSACTPAPTPTPLPTATAPLAQKLSTPTAQPTAEPPTPTLPSPTPQPSPEPQLCAGESMPPPLDATLTAPGASVEILWRPSFIPWWVLTSPDGRVLAVTYHGDSIYELKPDGTLAVAFRCPGVVIESFAAATDGALWFASWDGGRLYRAAPDGKVSLLAESGNRYLKAGPNGSVYAMENGLMRIEADGAAHLITAELTGNKFDIGPKGEILARKGADIVRVSESGELTAIATGFGPENGLAFGPDGLLYVIHWTGLQAIDLTSGERTVISWMDNNQLGEAGVFAPDGRLLIFNPNADVYAIDLASQTISPYHKVLGNSWAMAVNPNDGVYLAFGDELPDGETSIYRIRDEQTLELVASVPYGFERDMIFDNQGMGYLAVTNTARVGAIFRFDPSNGKIEEYWRGACSPSSLAFNPQTGQVWWEDCGTFYSLDVSGKTSTIPGVSNGFNHSLAITPQGEFYDIAFFPRTNPNDPFVHRLYRWDGQAWGEVADLTQSDPRITMSMIVACPDGHVYTVESLDAAHLPQQNESTFNAVRRLEPDGSLTLLGFNFSYDGLASDCDRAAGRIVFTSGAGIFALTPP